MSPDSRSGITGVLLLAYGTPGGLEDVEPYYTHIRRGGKPTPEELHELVERYRRVGGRTPLLDIIQQVRQALETRLSGESGESYRVYMGMKHWHPFIKETVHDMVRDGVQRIIGLPLAPHYSRMSIGEYRHGVEEALEALHATIPLRFVESWHRNPTYIQAVADKVRSALHEFPSNERDNVEVVFGAHSLPKRILEWNDPYPDELRESSDAVARSAGLNSWRWAWQSAGRTPEPWLEPDIREVLRELASEGRNNVVSVPFGFVVDNLETIYDIDIECQELAAELGIRLVRSASLNADPALVEALTDIVVNGTGASIAEVAPAASV